MSDDHEQVTGKDVVLSVLVISGSLALIFATIAFVVSLFIPEFGRGLVEVLSSVW